MDNYIIYRNDRNNLNSIHSRGGGVLIATHNRFHSIELTLSDPTLESVAVMLKLAYTKVIIMSIYIPPNSPTEIYNRHCTQIENLKFSFPDVTFLVVGDLNMPDVKWSNEDYYALLTGPASEKNKILAETVAFMQWFQHNSIVNYKNNILDLVFSNDSSVVVTKCPFPLVPIDIAHPPLQINGLNVSMSCKLKTSSPVFNFNRANYEAMNKYFNNIDWESLLSDSLDFSLVISNFYSIINEAINIYTPKFFNCNYKYPQWFSSELKSLIFNKKRLHKEFKSTNDCNKYNEFSRLRSLCKIESKKCRLRYLQKVQNDLRQNPKYFWRYIKNLKSDNDIPKTMLFNDKSSMGGPEVANLFKDCFCSVYSNVNLNINSCINYSKSLADICNQPSIQILISDVFEAISSLDCNPCPGPDGLPNILLRSCTYSLSIPICKIFNRSLTIGFFPSQWKNSFVTPIYKSGDKNLVTNYRPITKQSALPKLLEKLMIPSLTFTFNNILDNNQHGFRKGRSVETNLLCFYNTLINTMESGKQTDVIYMDFSKAFDSVNHSILIAKLSLFGVHDPLLSWFNSYLVGRSQQVKINGFLSDTFPVSSGVPQGGHLSPLLFAIFIMDISNCFKFCDYLLFADDLKIFANVSSLDNTSLIQNDLNKVSDWCLSNGLKLNTAKCFKMTFSRTKSKVIFDYYINDDKLVEINSCRDLGVVFQPNLLFSSNIEYLCSKALRSLGFLIRNTKEFNDERCLKTLYTSLVRPILEFSSVLWNPTQIGLVESLERVQRKFLRFIGYKRKLHGYLNPSASTSISSIQASIKLESLATRRKSIDIRFMSKLINGAISCPDLLHSLNFNIPQYNSRQRPTFSISFHHTSYGYNNPIDRIARECNELKHVDLFHPRDLYLIS